MRNYKHFVVCLKKMRDAGQIAQKAGKFRLLMGFKLELLMALEKGKSGKKVTTSSVSLKEGAKKTAANKGKGAAKKAQIERKAAAVAVRGKAGKIASAKKAKAAAAKKGAKKTLNKKISAANKANNSRKGAAKTQKGKGAAGKPAKGGIQSKRKQVKVDDAAVLGDYVQEKQDDHKAAVESTPKSAHGDRTSLRDSSAVALSNNKSGKKAMQASGKKSGADKSTASKAIKKGASAEKKGSDLYLSAIRLY